MLRFLIIERRAFLLHIALMFPTPFNPIHSNEEEGQYNIVNLNNRIGIDE